MSIEYLTLAITAIGWIVTAYFQRQLYKLQSETQSKLAEQQERYDRERELREHVIPERLAFLRQLHDWFTRGFALWQDAGVGLREISLDDPRDLQRLNETIQWGDQLMLMLPWALFNDPARRTYPDGSRLWTPEHGIPNESLADLMLALRHTVISIVNPHLERAKNPIPPRDMIEPLRMGSYVAIERVRSRILSELQKPASAIPAASDTKTSKPSLNGPSTPDKTPSIPS